MFTWYESSPNLEIREQWPRNCVAPNQEDHKNCFWHRHFTLQWIGYHMITAKLIGMLNWHCPLLKNVLTQLYPKYLLPIIGYECIRHTSTNTRQCSHQCKYLASHVSQCIATIEWIINENWCFCHHHEITECQIYNKHIRWCSQRFCTEMKKINWILCESNFRR